MALFYHIILVTAGCHTTLSAQAIEMMNQLIKRTLRDYRSTLHRVGGTANHLHILLEIHPDIAPSFMIREIKQFTARELTEQMFEGWEPTQFVATVSAQEKSRLERHIIDQTSYHRNHTIEQECKELVMQ